MMFCAKCACKWLCLGVKIPRGVCGPLYILTYVDNTNRIHETSESNNIVRLDVFVACADGRFLSCSPAQFELYFAVTYLKFICPP